MQKKYKKLKCQNKLHTRYIISRCNLPRKRAAMHSFSLVLKLAALVSAHCLAAKTICRAREPITDMTRQTPAHPVHLFRMTSAWHNFALKDSCSCDEQMRMLDDDVRNSGHCFYMAACTVRAKSDASNYASVCDNRNVSHLQTKLQTEEFTHMHFCDTSTKDFETLLSNHLLQKCAVQVPQHHSSYYRDSYLKIADSICVPIISGINVSNYKIAGGNLDLEIGFTNGDRKDCGQCTYSRYVNPGLENFLETTGYDSELSNEQLKVDDCSANAYSFSIGSQITEQACQHKSDLSLTHNMEHPLRYVAYNPTIPASRAWTCGFVEVFSTGLQGKPGKVCGKNKRSTGRLLAHAMCPQLSTSFDAQKHKVHAFVATNYQASKRHAPEDWLFDFETTKFFPNIKRRYNTFAEWNRRLLSRNPHWNYHAQLGTITEDPLYFGDGELANTNTRRTPVAHAFAMWEGTGRKAHAEGLLGGEGLEWVDEYYGKKTPSSSSGRNPSPRIAELSETRLVAWTEVNCVEALPLYHDEAHVHVVDFRDTTEFPDTVFPGASAHLHLGRVRLLRRAGEACYREHGGAKDWDGCVVYDDTLPGCDDLASVLSMESDAENCVDQESNARVEAVFALLDALAEYVETLVDDNPHKNFWRLHSTISAPEAYGQADFFDDLCTKTVLDISKTQTPPQTVECLESDDMTYLAVCCQGIQASQVPESPEDVPVATLQNFYPPASLTRDYAANHSFDVYIAPIGLSLQFGKILGHTVFVSGLSADLMQLLHQLTVSHANYTEKLPWVRETREEVLAVFSMIAQCTCRDTEVVDYVPVVVAEPEAQVLYTAPEDEAICATFTHFHNCTHHCTQCASRCKFFCADDFFGNGELDAPFLLFQNRTRFVRTCRPQTEVCTADRLPPLLPEHHPVAPPPRLTVHDVDAASLVARDPPAEGWAYALRSSDAAHTHNSMQCPVTEDCKHKVRIYDLPTHYIPGRFYSVLRATGVRLQSPSHLFSELDALTHQRCEKKCWDLGLHACSWFAVAPGSACYLGDANISHALRADMPLCHGADCAPFLAHMDSRYVTIDSEAQEFRVYGMAAYLAHTHRVPSTAQNRDGLREVQAFSFGAHECAALCAHDLRCTRYAAWDDGVCAVDWPGEGNFTDVPGEETVMQVGLGNVETVEICVDGVLDATYQQFYRNDSVLSCAQNAAREPVAQTCQECPADQNAEWPWCGDFFFALCDRCIACPDGQIRPFGEDECRYCTRQEFYDIATGECVECLPHHRRSDDSPFRCEPCALKDAKCKRCPEGTARDLRYALRSASTLGEVCVPCPDDAVGETTNACACAPGWMLDKAQGVCVACPPGTAKAQYGDDACKACLPGTAAPRRGAARCAQCLRDRGPGITSTVQCLPVVFAQNAEEECAEDAGKVRWSLENGQGFVCLPQAVAEVQGVPCREGFERVEVMPGAHVCLPCGLGWFRDNTTAACVPCRQLGVNYSRTTCEESEACLHWATVGDAVAGLAGRWDLVPQVVQGSRGPDEVVCEDSHVRDVEHDVCVRCAEGFEAQDNACVPCGPGNWTVQELTGCRPCPGNMTSRMPEGCVCREGEAPGEGGQCVKCAQGFFKQVAGNASCVECQREWEVTPEEGAVSCVECPEYAKPLGNTSRCVCGPGLVMGVEGVCEKCAQGKMSAGFDDADECEECLAGTFERERVKCEECAIGTFSAEARQMACKACPVGTFVNYTAATLCYDCQRGTFSAYLGSTVCELCAPGKFVNDTAATLCSDCQRGTFSAYLGSTVCELCAPGKFVNDTAATLCSDCQRGTFSAYLGSTVCELCAPGTFINYTKATSCTNCLNGAFSLNFGNSACEFCVPGKYADESRMNQCLECAIGKFSDSLGATRCFECASGSYQADSGQSVCLDCPSGTYNSNTAQPQCTNCPGQLSTENAQSQSVDDCNCAPGSYFVDGGGDGGLASSQCLTCAQGKYYGAWGRQTQCEDCTLNQISNGGRTGCSHCRCDEMGQDGNCIKKSPGDSCTQYNANSNSFVLCSPGYYNHHLPRGGPFVCCRLNPYIGEMSDYTWAVDFCPQCWDSTEERLRDSC